MTADLSFIADASQRNTHVRLLHCTGQRLRNRSLSGSRRSRKAEDRTVTFLCEGTHREKFQNTLLDLFKTVMVFIKDFFCVLNIIIIFCRLIPRHLKQRLDIGTDHPVLCRRVQGTLETVDLLLQLFFYFFRSL